MSVLKEVEEFYKADREKERDRATGSALLRVDREMPETITKSGSKTRNTKWPTASRAVDAH
jgi:hypothetical protein